MGLPPDPALQRPLLFHLVGEHLAAALGHPNGGLVLQALVHQIHHRVIALRKRLIHVQRGAELRGIPQQRHVRGQAAGLLHGVEQQAGIAIGRMNLAAFLRNLPIAAQRRGLHRFLRPKGVKHLGNRLDEQIARLVLPQLMDDQVSAPVPGVAVLARIAQRIEVVLVALAGGVPAVHEPARAVAARLGGVEGAGIEGVDVRRQPGAVQRAALAVERLEAVGIGGKHQVIPVAPLEQVRALEGALGVPGRVQRLAILPVMQILRLAQADAGAPRGGARALRGKDHPPALLLLHPEHEGIAEVHRLIDMIVRTEAVLRDLPPGVQVFAHRMVDVVALRTDLEGAIEHVIEPVHLDDGARAADDVGVMLLKMHMILGREHDPAVAVLRIAIAPVIAQIERLERAVVIEGNDISQHGQIGSEIHSHYKPSLHFVQRRTSWNVAEPSHTASPNLRVWKSYTRVDIATSRFT